MHRAALMAASLAVGCSPPIEFEDHWMDSPLTQDPSLSDASFLLSTRIPAPTDLDLRTPVVVAVHGFGGSTFEWVELRDAAEARGVLVSLVLLGGHGRSIDAWAETDADDWRAPIVDELRALDALGYERISIATASTGGPLLLQSMLRGELDDLRPPREVMMVAPFIVSTDKRLYAVPLLGLVMNNHPVVGTEREKELFYCNRPAAVFPPLMDLLLEIEGVLKGDGVALPAGTNVTAWFSDDAVVAPDSATLLERGLHGDGTIDVVSEATTLHVHTRGIGRARTLDEVPPEDDAAEPRLWTDDDDARQARTFDEMIERATRP